MKQDNKKDGSQGNVSWGTWDWEDDLDVKSRYPDGCCQSCGYDLTGNTSGVCPECGARAVSKDVAERTLRIKAVQAHYLGDKVAIVVFAVISIGGLICGVCTDGELQLLGFCVAWSFGFMVPWMIGHIFWLRMRARRIGVPLTDAKITVASERGWGKNTKGC